MVGGTVYYSWWPTIVVRLGGREGERGGGGGGGGGGKGGREGGRGEE